MSIITIARKGLTAGLVIFMIFIRAMKSEDTRKKFTTEITYSINENIIKFRPFDYTLPSKNKRVDFMLGRRFRKSFGDITVYGYWKLDNKKRSWIGTRFDCSMKSLKNRLNARIQFRLFCGLNERSENHFYYISTVYYQTDQKGRYQVGFLGYGKKSKGKSPFFYVGPSLNLKFNKYISTNASYGINVLYGGDMTYWKINFSF
jgi:hypothetical protein